MRLNYSILDDLELVDDTKSEILEKAHVHIHEKSRNIISQEERHKYHLMPEIGWMNDPNGFSVFNDEYHLFYQYYPYDVKWGPMYWGHAKSRDLIKWEYAPVALAPDKSYDISGCFSGSAIQVEDKHVLMYTGHVDNEQGVRQVQCIAVGDGTKYRKIKNNPVIATDEIPDESNISDFRDPKIWYKDGNFYSVMGSRHSDESGKVLMYKSANLIKWNYIGTLDFSRHEIGGMWECPDVFNLDNKDVFILSPQDYNEFGHRSVYSIGGLDYNTGKFTGNEYKQIDYGLDFYAPQTTISPDGRRIMVAWMQAWHRNIPSDKFGWVGAMILPRELKVINNKLYQYPVKELNKYRKNPIEYKNISLNGHKIFDGIEGKTIELKLNVEFKEGNEFSLKIMKSEGEETLIKYDKTKRLLIFDRSNSTKTIKGPNVIQTNIDLKDNTLSLNIFMDVYSVEIFAQNGEKTMTSTVYSELESTGIEFFSDSLISLDISKWDLDIK